LAQIGLPVDESVDDLLNLAEDRIVVGTELKCTDDRPEIELAPEQGVQCPGFLEVGDGGLVVASPVAQPAPVVVGDRMVWL